MQHPNTALPARLTRLSRLVGRLFCVRCVFRRCRVCRAVIAGSCLCVTETASGHGPAWLHYLGNQPQNGAVPELCVQQGVVIEDEGLEVHQASHLRREALQLVVAQVKVKQVREVDEKLIRDGLDTAGTWGPSGWPWIQPREGDPE